MNFDDKFNELLTSMMEICLEYIDYNDNEVEKTFAYGCLEEFYSFEWIYQIKGKIVDRDKVNKYTKKKYDVSHDMQQQVLDAATSDLMELADIFKSDNRQVPTHIKMIYNNKTEEFESQLIYDKLLKGDLMPTDIFEDWIKELK